MKAILTLLLLTGTCGPGPAQAPGVPVEDSGSGARDPAIVLRAGALRESGKLVSASRIMEMLQIPVPSAIHLPPAATLELSRPQIYERARRSRVRVGWYYLCTSCHHWHTQLAGGYPLTPDGVIATCEHVVHPPAKMQEGYLIILDSDGQVYPVTGILAASASRDTCLLKAEGDRFEALPLNDQVRPGDAAYCLSDPLGSDGYFSEGIVNRFYRKEGTGTTPDEALRLNVSTDWAPGSSGSPVLDQCGNVIGHVSTITPLTSPRQEAPPKDAAGPRAGRRSSPPGTQIVLHEACPSRSVRQLAEQATGNARAANSDRTSGTGTAPLEPNGPASIRGNQGFKNPDKS